MPERTAEAGHLHSTDGTPVVLYDVHFLYRGDEVLRGTCMSVAAGEICALVGDNGAGKSTRAARALRFFCGMAIGIFSAAMRSSSDHEVFACSSPHCIPSAWARSPGRSLRTPPGRAGAGSRSWPAWQAAAPSGSGRPAAGSKRPWRTPRFLIGTSICRRIRNWRPRAWTRSGTTAAGASGKAATRIRIFSAPGIWPATLKCGGAA